MTKNELIKKHAADIDEYAKYIGLLEALLESFNIEKDASPLINFRDALAHYVKLYESDNDLVCFGNSYAIDEHLNRGIKDIIVFFTIILRLRIETLTNSFQVRFKPNSEKLKLTKISHELSNLNLDIRVNFGAFVTSEIEKYIERLNKLLNDLTQILKDWDIPLKVLNKRSD